MREVASARRPEVTTPHRFAGMEFTSSMAPGIRRTLRSSASRCSIFEVSASASRWGAAWRMTSTVRTPCAARSTQAGSSPCSSAQTVYCRATAAVESTKTPSKSNSNAAQRNEVADGIDSLGRPGRCAQFNDDLFLDPAFSEFQVFAPKMRHGALAPGAHEIEVQACPDERTGERNQATGPLLHHFAAGLHGDALDHARHKTVDHLFFQQLAADIDPGGAGCRDPEVGNFILGVELEAVNQAELLDGAHGDGRENAEIGYDGHDPAQAQAGAFGGSDLHPAANDGFGDVIEVGQVDRVHPLKGRDGQPIRGAELNEELLRVDLHGLVSAGQPLDQCAFNASAKP